MAFTYNPEEAQHIAGLVEESSEPTDPDHANPAYWRHLAEVEAERYPAMADKCREYADCIECEMVYGEELP